jgi:LCP family protein required for cell wall assembly
MVKRKATKKAQKKPMQDLSARYSSYDPRLKTAPPILAAPQDQEPEAKPRKWRKYIARVLILFLVGVFSLVLIVGIWDARNISSASQKMFGSGSLFELASTQPLKGSERGRVNVLLIGYSVDDPGHPAAKLTDSLMVLSMSTSSHKGYILSIPRDLYVNIPGHGYAKINEAYQDGGTELLSSIITLKFGLPVNYYALINYASVRQSVDALGGITVKIKSSDPRGLYDPNISKHDGGPLKLVNGTQSLDGQTALNLTRARGDDYRAYGFSQADFDRTQHQRQVFTAIKDKLNWKLILNPRQNSEVLNAFAGNIKTDIKATEIRSIFGLFNSIPSSHLESVSLRTLNGKNYLASYRTPFGQSALIPASGIDNYSDIVDALTELNQ